MKPKLQPSRPLAKFFAVKCEQNGRIFYLSSVPSTILAESSFVSRRDEQARHTGFQRLLNEARAKDIARYMDEQNGVIPSALILSSQPQASFYFDKNHATIEYAITEGSFLVIDGQHRLFGFQKTKKEYQIPVVIFENLKTQDEVKLFIDINTTQKGVPAALLLDIKSLAGTETKIEERQRILFNNLNSNSALQGKFSPSKSSPGKISRALFNDATGPIFTSGPLATESDDIIFKAVSNYISAMNHTFGLSKNPSAKLNKSIYFKASLSLFHEVTESVLKEYSNMKEESFSDILEPISSLAFDNYTGTNNQTITKLSNDMRTAMHQRRRKTITHEMF